MSEWQTFRTLLLRACCVLIVAGTIVALSPLIFGVIREALEYGQREAGYHCTGQECSTEEADARVAFFTWVLALVTGGLVIVTGALFWATYRLYQTTVHALERSQKDSEETRRQARELFTAERRPWIAIRREVSGDLLRAGTRGIVNIKVTLENVGLSPAIDVRFEWPAEPLRSGFSFVDRERIRERIEIVRKRNHSDQLGITVFPGGKFEETYIATGDIADENGNRLLTTIACWVSYRGAPLGPLHFTPYAWNLVWRPDEFGVPLVGETYLSESRLGLNPD